MGTRVTKDFMEGAYQAFPEGLYIAELDHVDERDFGTKGEEDWGFNLQPYFQDLKPADEDTEDPGARPYRADISVVSQGTSLVQLEREGKLTEETLAPNEMFPLRRGYQTLTQIAFAVGAIEFSEEGEAVFELEQFISALREGNYNKQKFLIRITHYTPKRGARKGKVQDQLDSVGSIPA